VLLLAWQVQQGNNESAYCLGREIFFNKQQSTGFLLWLKDGGTGNSGDVAATK